MCVYVAEGRAALIRCARLPPNRTGAALLLTPPADSRLRPNAKRCLSRLRSFHTPAHREGYADLVCAFFAELGRAEEEQRAERARAARRAR